MLDKHLYFNGCGVNQALITLKQLVKIVLQVNPSTDILKTKEITGPLMVDALSDRSIDLVGPIKRSHL